MTDENVAKYLLHLSRKHNFKPHHKKFALAALNKVNKILGIQSIFDDQRFWHKTHLVIMKWDSHLKMAPYFPKQASHYSCEALLAICNLVAEDTTQVIDLVIVSTRCWTSIRAEDITYLKSKNVQRLNASPEFETPRRWRFVAERLKNDPRGEGPIEYREFVVPCVCLQMLSPSQVKILFI